MAVDVLIRPTQPGDIELLMADLRPCDRAEVEASAGRAFWPIMLRGGARSSVFSMTSFADGKLANMFGVAPISFVEGIGSPWMLATPEFDRHPRAVIRHCRAYIAPMLAVFPHLINHVDARNVRSVTWLKWLGFEMHEPEPYGPYGVLFHKFEMRA